MLSANSSYSDHHHLIDSPIRLNAVGSDLCTVYYTPATFNSSSTQNKTDRIAQAYTQR